MALMDVFKCEVNNKEFVSKFTSSDWIGRQVVVYPSQTAFFVKDGVIYDQFPQGNYIISTQNIPLLNKVLNIPLGSEPPLSAELWFVNLINKLDCKWGTIAPIQLKDPKYGIVVPVRAFGQYGMKICRPKMFLQTLINYISNYSANTITDYFKGKILSMLTSLISQKIAIENISILEINAHLDSLSSFCQEKLDFKNYGVDIVNFNFMAINLPENDEGIKRLKDIVLINANPQIVAPPPPPVSNYFVYVNEQQLGPYTMNELKNLAKEGKINRNSHVWKQGMSNWEEIGNVPELKLIITMVPPPPPTK